MILSHGVDKQKTEDLLVLYSFWLLQRSSSSLSYIFVGGSGIERLEQKCKHCILCGHEGCSDIFTV